MSTDSADDSIDEKLGQSQLPFFITPHEDIINKIDTSSNIYIFDFIITAKLIKLYTFILICFKH